MSRRKTAQALLRVTGVGPVDHHTVWRGRKVHIKNRGEGAPMGRFGGGWERNLGVQLGGRRRDGQRTIIVSLWRGSIRVDPKP